MGEKLRHYEKNVSIPVPPEQVFSYVDDHRNFSSHMNQSNWMMAGSQMSTELDEGQGQRVGSHIRMDGRVLGAEISLDEVVTEYEPPLRKAWETVGEPKLIIMGNYKMGVDIKPDDSHSNLTVSIDYELPKSSKTRWLGRLFGRMYAKWCVNQMANGTQDHFNPSKPSQ